MDKKVSVIVACYNEPENIFRRSLESVIAQTKQEIEIIVVLDNPENAELKGIIEEYKSQTDKIIPLYPEKNLGRAGARNLGVENATGDYIAIHDGDDVANPLRLEEQTEFMEQNPQVSILFSNVIHTDINGNEVTYKKDRNPDLSQPSIFSWALNHVTMFAKSEILKKYKYREKFDVCEDYDLWIRMHVNGEIFAHMERNHTNYLTPQESPHSDFILKMRDWRYSLMKILFENFQHFYKDKTYYKVYVILAMDYFFLLFGKEAFTYYRKYLFEVLKVLKLLKRKLVA